MSKKIVYLMRGLPSCGKSFTAKKVAGNRGVVCETDEYFHTQVGDDPTRYDYDRNLLATARRWNLERFAQALADGLSPVVVDRGNSLSRESQQYARLAVEAGYDVEIREPESPWWQEIRVLLKYKHLTKPVLYEWSLYLAALNRSSHRVSAESIRRRMAKWRHGLTLEEILNFAPARQAESAAVANPRDAKGDGTARRGVVVGDTLFGDGLAVSTGGIASADLAVRAVDDREALGKRVPANGPRKDRAAVFDHVTGGFAPVRPDQDGDREVSRRGQDWATPSGGDDGWIIRGVDDEDLLYGPDGEADEDIEAEGARPFRRSETGTK